MSGEQKVSKMDVVSVSFLVAGTCIGGGMLGLPVGSGMAGFIPSLLMLFFCWAFMTISGLLVLEVNLWMKEGSHIITMASEMLGKWGKCAAWILYLFIGYASLVAYIAGGGEQIIEALQSTSGVSLGKFCGCGVFVLLFGSIISFGGKFVGRVNTILFISMVLAYILLIGVGGTKVKLSLLSYQNWGRSFISVPLFLTAFSFQTIVPSLTPTLKGNARHLRAAIVSGTTIAFFVYLLWQSLVLGTMPLEGPYGLEKAFEQGVPATIFLRKAVQSPWLSIIAEFFAFFALVTSFLGISLGLFDFLSDGLKIRKIAWGKILLGVLVLAPSLFFSVSYSRIFMLAMETSGGFGDTILNGIMPVLMVWVGRYYRGMHSEYPCPGGKFLLIVVLLFYFFVFGLESIEQISGASIIQSAD